MHDLKWLFFDIGSTLTDEAAAYARRVDETVRGTNVSREAFTEAMMQYFAEGKSGYAEAVRAFGLNKTPWHSEYEQPYPDCAPTLKALFARGYRLGVIANQLPGTRERLMTWGLLPYFSVIAASAECGCAKPSPALFMWALHAAGCAPEKAAMIGDRVDNDILPAKELGMKTVRVLTGPGAAFRPLPDPADVTVSCLFDLLTLF